jgi:opacity protein-like surface antigen
MLLIDSPDLGHSLISAVRHIGHWRWSEAEREREMTSIRGSVLVSAALLLCSIVSVQAGDVFHGRDGGMKGGYYPAVATNPSWYLRLDGTYAAHDDPVMVEEGRFDLIQREYDTTWSFGGGFGHYFTKNIRADLTYDYRFDSDISGTRDRSAVGGGVREFGISSQVLLANIYYDFNRGGRFNPYLGIGLGGVYHKTDSNTMPANCTCTATIGEGDGWHVAGAFMAGVAMKLHHKINLDLGYRFLYMGQVETGGVNAPAGNPVGNIASDISVEDMHAHEFRFGLRYDLR